ncbi:MAG: hypothetical protein JXM70_03640 [Pirellulales bacterium]|nr:hypothetical protein [Pirellulales bacterium]
MKNINKGTSESSGSASYLASLVGTFVAVTGFACGLTYFNLGFQALLKRGGFVASGGPYAIEHQAPAWSWTLFVSFIVATIFMFMNFKCARKTGGLHLLALAWPALFLSLGAGFLLNGISPPADISEGPVISWLICAAIFLLLGTIPLLFILSAALKVLLKGASPIFTGPLPWQMKYHPPGSERPKESQVIVVLLTLLNLAAVSLGIYGGMVLFRLVLE